MRRSLLLPLALVTLGPALARCSTNAGTTASAGDSGAGAGDAAAADARRESGKGTSTGSGTGSNSGTGSGAGASTAPAWATAPEHSSGCGVAATPSGTDGDARTVTVNGVDRSYIVYVPPGYDPTRNYPVVLEYHGIGATGAEMAAWIQMQDYSAGNAIVAFPSAVNGNWDLTGATDLAFFDAMTASLESTLCVNERRIFVLGFSLGAYMANSLGCHRSGAIRAFIPADGGFPGATAGCGKTTVLVYHRAEDDNEPIANGEAARDDWLGIDGCAQASTPITDFGFAGLGCVQYEGCPTATTVAWCDDTATSPYKHDLRDVYRVPMWNWFNHF